MAHSSQTLAYGADNTLHYQSWRPPSAVRGVVFVIHGLAEHGGRYQEFAAQLNKSGFAVATLDLPGHGRSSGKRCSVTHFDHYLGAAEHGHMAAEKEFGATTEIPHFLLGHSMGGLIASLYLQRHQKTFSGAMFSGAAVASEPVPSKLQKRIASVLATLFPSLGMLKLDATGVSRDPAVVERYLQDPLVYTGKLPVCFLAAMFAAMDQAVAGLGNIATPALVMHGEADSIVPVKASHLLVAGIGSEDKTLRLFPELFHEIINEPERTDVVAEMIRWAEQRV